MTLSSILIVYGIAYLLSESVLLEKPREWIAKRSRLLGNMVYCNICLSYWIGLAITGSILQAFAIMGAIALTNKLLYERKTN